MEWADSANNTAKRCHEYMSPHIYPSQPFSLTLCFVQLLTLQILNPREGMFSPVICSFTSLYWVKRGQVISWDCLPYFLSRRAICVSSVGCIRPGRYDTSTKPVPFYPLFQSAPSNIIFSLPCAFLLIPSVWLFMISLSSPIIFAWFISPHLSPSSSITTLLSSHFLLLLSSPTADRPDPAWWWHFTHADPSRPEPDH